MVETTVSRPRWIDGVSFARTLSALVLFQLAGWLASLAFSRALGGETSWQWLLASLFWILFCLAGDLVGQSRLTLIIGAYLGGLLFFDAILVWLREAESSVYGPLQSLTWLVVGLLAIGWPLAAAGYGVLRSAGWPVVAALPVAWLATENLIPTVVRITMGPGTEFSLAQIGLAIPPGSLLSQSAYLGGVPVVGALWGGLVGSMIDVVNCRFRAVGRYLVLIFAICFIPILLPDQEAESLEIVVVPRNFAWFDEVGKYLPEARDPPLPTGADLVIFSEGALGMEWIAGAESTRDWEPDPHFVYGEGEVRSRVDSLCETLQAAIAVGCVRRSQDGHWRSRFNSFLFVDSRRSDWEVRDKRCLVPLSEGPIHVGPWRLTSWRPTQFQTGAIQPPIHWTTRRGTSVSMTPAVCFEIACPDHLRRVLGLGNTSATRCLVAVGNENHLDVRGRHLFAEQAVWRAIEFRMPVIHCVALGISLVCDSSGRRLLVHDSTIKVRPEFFRSSLPVSDRLRSPSTLLGNWIMWGSLSLVLAVWVWSVRRQQVRCPTPLDALEQVIAG